MSLAVDIMGGGISAGAARAINGTINATVTAAGTTQADATALMSTNVFISTAAASTGVLLPNASHGDDLIIYNGGANPVKVYPPVSGKINNLSTNAAFTLATNTAVWVRKMTGTQWVAILSA